MRPYLKPNKEKGVGVAQVVECMFSKCEALSSNPHIAKKNRERKEINRKRNHRNACRLKNKLCVLGVEGGY
jgi:hypothetical protein